MCVFKYHALSSKYGLRGDGAKHLEWGVSRARPFVCAPHNNNLKYIHMSTLFQRSYNNALQGVNYV
jgi:hypothetical protein